jgi:hypothetical protein
LPQDQRLSGQGGAFGQTAVYVTGFAWAKHYESLDKPTFPTQPGQPGQGLILGFVAKRERTVGDGNQQLGPEVLESLHSVEGRHVILALAGRFVAGNGQQGDVGV